jgi:putative ABC transport system permease protein
VVFLPAANLAHRKTRGAVAVAAIAVSVATIMLLVGLAQGTLGAIGHRLQSVGADLLFQPPDASLVLGVTSAVMPLALMDDIQKAEGVRAVAPVLNWQVSQVRGDPESLNLWAVDGRRFEELSGGFDLLAGRPLRGPNEVIVDSNLAERRRIEIGDRLPMLGGTFEVVGICRSGFGGRLYARIEDVGAAVGTPGRASFFLVKGSSPREAGALRQRLSARWPGYKLTLIAQVSHTLEHSVVGLREMEAAVTGLAVAVSFLVVLLAMYTAILERTREIGIMRALGATPLWVVSVIVMESLLLCASGVAAGLGLAFLGRYGLHHLYPSEEVLFSARTSGLAVGVGLVSAVLGASYPAFRAARLDPIRALSFQ